MHPFLRTIALGAVLVGALMVSIGVAGSPWDIRMTPEGCAGVALVGLLVAYVGTSLALGGRR
jgi:hypothetical protein